MIPFWTTAYYNVKNGVSNLIKWTPIIWNDRQYDEKYMFKVIHEKLSLMEEFFRSDKAYTEDANETADEIKIAKDACERLSEDNYVIDAFEDYYEKYPFGTIPLRTLEEVNGFEKYVVKDEEQLKLFHEASDNTDKARERDNELLFEHMKKYNANWWD